MQAVSPPLAADRVRTESSVASEVLALATLLLLASPLLLSLAGRSLALPWTQSLGGHTARQVTGYVGLSLLAFQVLLSARLRLHRGGSLARWTQLHKRAGVAIALVLLAHTGGRWGVHLNGWLLGSLVAMMLVAQTGHVMKALVASRAAALPAVDVSVNSEHGDVHRAGLFLHVAFAVCVLCFLTFHVLSVYYF